MNNLEQEKYQFEDNDNNRLPTLSYNKRIAFIVFSCLIAIFIFYAIFNGKLVWAGRRHNLIFSGASLYILLSSGLVWIYHFVIQLIADKTDDDKKNNNYFKQAYNTRIIALILMIISYLIAAFLDINPDYKIDSKYKKETMIYY